MAGDLSVAWDQAVDLPTIDLTPDRGVVVGQDDCIDFEDLPALATYTVGDSFVADDSGLQAKFHGEGFTWNNGLVTLGGAAGVSHANLAGHVGQDISINNILLNVDFGGSVNGVRILFGEYGGNLNLEVNGHFVNFENFNDIDGSVIGGVNVAVVNGFGNDAGHLTLLGVVNSLKVGGQELWIDHVCVGREPQERMDWGDAPDKPYPTLAVNNGAHHRVDPEVHLGKRIDAERDGQPTLTANGDDQNAGLAVDDEDGVVFVTPLIPGQTAEVEVWASKDGWLNSWIDFDRDGSWTSSPAENIFSGQPLLAGSNLLTFLVPAAAKPGPNEPTYSRWRFSTTDQVLRPSQPAGAAVPNGEVEDHLAFIQERDPEPQGRWDFGDAPDKPYPTLLTHLAARHRIDPKIHLGSRIDAELNGQPDYLALGDDSAGVDDEDGVKFLSPIIPGKELKIAVEASVDGKLDAWIDFNQNGDWEPSEQIAVSDALAAGNNFISVFVPADAVPHPTRPVYSRFRLSTAGGLDPTGPARDGEVEDYALLNGDLNHDGQIDERDINLLCRALHANAQVGDVNGDGQSNEDDMDYLVHEILDTEYGDANLDGLVNSTDLIQVFAAGEYEDEVPHNSRWGEGDWNCDGEFDSSDLIKMMQTGAYESANISTALAAFANESDMSNDTAASLPSSLQPSPEDCRSPQQKRLMAIAEITDSIFSDEPESLAGESVGDDVAELFAIV